MFFGTIELAVAAIGTALAIGLAATVAADIERRSAGIRTIIAGFASIRIDIAVAAIRIARAALRTAIVLAILVQSTLVALFWIAGISIDFAVAAIRCFRAIALAAAVFTSIIGSAEIARLIFRIDLAIAAIRIACTRLRAAAVFTILVHIRPVTDFGMVGIAIDDTIAAIRSSLAGIQALVGTIIRCIVVASVITEFTTIAVDRTVTTVWRVLARGCTGTDTVCIIRVAVAVIALLAAILDAITAARAGNTFRRAAIVCRIGIRAAVIAFFVAVLDAIATITTSFA